MFRGYRTVYTLFEVGNRTPGFGNTRRRTEGEPEEGGPDRFEWSDI